MKVALIQFKVSDAQDRNIARGVQAIADASRAGARLVAFPELCFTPFYPQYPANSRSASLAEPADGATVKAIARAARDHDVVVIINLFEKDGERTFDTSVVIDADGQVLGKCRMLHITDYAFFHEQGYYREGDTYAPVFETAVGRLGICICYDRHFPEYLRSLAVQRADLVIIPQAGTTGEWPGDMYTAEIRVASFQNGFYCAMVNRVGVEGGMEFSGESVVTDPFGKVVAQAATGTEEILYADIDLTQCDESPARRLFLRHRRPEIYTAGGVTIAPASGS